MVHINKLKLYNFRCFKNYEINFSTKINILVGNNAVGKTSIVEAIHGLGLAKSHRTNNDQQLIKHGEEFAIIKGVFENNQKTSEISLTISEKGKKIISNNKPFNNLSDYIGFLNVVMFCPEDLDLVKGSPATRRKFLDSNISQINNLYLRNSIIYRKILKERNELLKIMAESDSKDYNLLSVYTQSLLKEAKSIIETRRKFIDKLNPYILNKTKAISDAAEKAIIKYLPSVEEGQLEEVFKANLKNDLFYKTTTKGPHRDDFLIELNNQNVADFGSQGQQRTTVLAIKLALAELINQNSDNLIIILDDVFSELDLNRQNEIINLLSDSNQIFITTTSVDNLTTKVLNNSSVITISKECEDSGE